MAKEKYNKDNILQWSEADFDEVKIAICKVRFENNILLTPSLMKTWCSLDDNEKYPFLKTTDHEQATVRQSSQAR